MNTTKEQERKALEKIRTIVDGLGENSYVATAFAGCFEIAEQNIEYDFADSYKERCENAEAKLSKANKDITAFKKVIEETQNSAEHLKEQVENYQSKALSGDDLVDVEQLIDDKLTDIKNEIQNQSALIVSLAENPESGEFKQAVKSHRVALGSLKYYEALKSKVQNSFHDIH
ncbi:MAG: hypothetical protein NC452_16960 [Eubacterium sp.]|nr:hypothetical protein [Eubacterium sp.]